MTGTIKDIRFGKLAAVALAMVFGMFAAVSPGSAQAHEVSTAAAASEEISIQANCGDTRDVYISGGEGHWTINCSGGDTVISGWHKDTDDDGRCIQVYGSVAGNSFTTPRACPEGEEEYWTRTLEGTTSISVYLRSV